MDPKAAAIVANKYVEKFMDYLADNISNEMSMPCTYLQERAAELTRRTRRTRRSSSRPTWKEKNPCFRWTTSLNLVADALRVAATQPDRGQCSRRAQP